MKKIFEQYFVFWLVLNMFISTSFAMDGDKPRTQLRVALYPGIPDAGDDNHERLCHKIQKNFVKSHMVDLSIRPINKNENFYDLDHLSELLNGTMTTDPVDVIEIDALILGKLREKGLIDPWPNDVKDMEENWHPAARQACYFDNEKEDVWGVPHWLCSYFIFGYREELKTVGSLTEYFSILEEQQVSRPHLAMDLLGKYTSTSLYLSSYASQFFEKSENSQEMWGKATTTFHIDALAPLQSAAKACSQISPPRFNHGLHEFYHVKTESAPVMFVNKIADNYAGFGESLHHIHKLNGSGSVICRLIPYAQKGDKGSPAVFVDVFVMRKNISQEKQQAAMDFVRYMNHRRTVKLITLSRDVADKGKRIPRYLIPATLDAQEHLAKKKKEYSPYYKTFKEELENSIAFPIVGIPDVVQNMSVSIVQQLSEIQ